MAITELSAPRSTIWTVLGVLVLLLVELTTVGTIFKHSIDFHCLDHWPPQVCSGASKSLIAAYCLLAVCILLRMLRPAPFQALIQQAGERLWPLLINFLGVAISLIPIMLLDGATGTGGIAPSLAAWTVGMTLMMLGAGLVVAPAARWAAFVRTEWSSFLPGLILASAAPWIATQLRPLWSVEWITSWTFAAVEEIMRSFGYDLLSDPETRTIGAGEFFVQIADACSGIEGIALVTIFVSLYLWIFRSDLRFPLALVLYPVGIIASVMFNMVRISALLVIGLEGNPELAVDGFHSHAGWLMFTLVALGLIALAQTLPGLRKEIVVDAQTVGGTLPPFWQDPAVAQILPFIVFMFSALIASTLSQTPSAIYPLRVLAMVAVMAFILPFYLRLPWRVDPVAVGVGGLIAAYWILIPVEAADTAAPYGALTGGLLMLWFVARGIGTTVLIPIIEELFFRGYLEKRLRFGTGWPWIAFAAVVSAVLFAALHGRWVEAFLAGLLFSYVAQRRGNITDAIVAHGVANGVIFAAAIIKGDLTII